MENRLLAQFGEASIIEDTRKDADGHTCTKQYVRKRLLGKGGFAEVFEVANLETSELQAAKIVSKAMIKKLKVDEKLMNEIEIHRGLVHRNVVGFDRYFEDSTNVYILLELCANQTLNELSKRRKKLTEPEVKVILVQLLSGLKYIHSCKVIHRDIKLGNVFLDENMTLKIGDFGLATTVEYEGQRRTTICGTPNYISPEILSGSHSYETDVWSLGVLVYTLLVGFPPFKAIDTKLTYKLISKSEFTFPSYCEISEEARQLIRWTLSASPAARPSLDQITQHAFLTNTSIPKTLPPASLAVPPSFIREKPRISVPLVKKESYIEVPTPKTMSPPQPKRNICASSLKNQTFSVKMWADYSRIYGLIYLLSNHTVGVSFNDSTRMLSSGNNVTYTQKVGLNQEEETIEFQISSFPKSLAKKVGVLQNFKRQFGVMGNSDEQTNFFVEKWLKTSHAIVFKLSNHIAQAYFNDGSELIIRLEENSYEFLDRNNEHCEGTLNGNYTPSMLKRIKYVKDVLNTVLRDSAKAPKN